MTNALEKVENGKTRGKHGGKRNNSGRKKIAKAPQVKEILETHVNEVVDMQVIDKKTGNPKMVKMTRLLAMLEKLYQVAMQDRSHEAMGKWLDRALGKAIQPVDHDPKNTGKPLMVAVSEEIAKKNGLI